MTRVTLLKHTVRLYSPRGQGGLWDFLQRLHPSIQAAAGVARIHLSRLPVRKLSRPTLPTLNQAVCKALAAKGQPGECNSGCLGLLRVNVAVAPLPRPSRVILCGRVSKITGIRVRAYRVSIRMGVIGYV